MKPRYRCPECNQWLNQEDCSCLCGWQTNNVVAATPDHRCSYQLSGRRCRFPGVTCSSPYSSCTWHCAGHHQELSNPKRCEEILLESETNYEAVMDARIDWRYRLFPEDFYIFKSKIKK